MSYLLDMLFKYFKQPHLIYKQEDPLNVYFWYLTNTILLTTSLESWARERGKVEVEEALWGRQGVHLERDKHKRSITSGEKDAGIFVITL